VPRNAEFSAKNPSATIYSRVFRKKTEKFNFISPRGNMASNLYSRSRPEESLCAVPRENRGSNGGIAKKRESLMALKNFREVGGYNTQSFKRIPSVSSRNSCAGRITARIEKGGKVINKVAVGYS